jgi:hypothetical protein
VANDLAFLQPIFVGQKFVSFFRFSFLFSVIIACEPSKEGKQNKTRQLKETKEFQIIIPKRELKTETQKC